MMTSNALGQTPHTLSLSRVYLGVQHFGTVQHFAPPGSDSIARQDPSLSRQRLCQNWGISLEYKNFIMHDSGVRPNQADHPKHLVGLLALERRQLARNICPGLLPFA
jgi:hypothetical protein